MTLRIDLDADQNPWYTNQDILRGTGVLDLKSSLEINYVKVSLFGVCRTELTRIDDVGQKFTDNVEDFSTFLFVEKQLFPPKDQKYASKYALRAGNHSWPFEFDFPALGTSGVMLYTLPPSLSDLDPDMAAIRYYVEISCEKASTGSSILGASIKKSRKYLDFLPSDDSWIDKVPTYGAKSTHCGRVISNVKSVSGLFSRLISTLAHDKAPNCIDVADFTVRTELLLTPGQKFTWLLEGANYHHCKEKVTVVGVKVILMSYTNVRAKNVDENVTQSILLLDKQQLSLKVPGDLTSQMGSPVLNIPESVPPTFTNANIKRHYKLLYKIKWSHEPGSALIHKTDLFQGVCIRSGISSLPNYDTGEVYRPSRNFPQAKWYYKQ